MTTETTLLQRVEIDKLNNASTMLRVIAQPIRLAIVDVLHQNGRLTVTQIQEKVGLEQAIASQQLTLMQDKGVLSSEKVGRNRFFFLRHPNMIKIVFCLEDCCSTF